jgi:hypothetical protein
MTVTTTMNSISLVLPLVKVLSCCGEIIRGVPVVKDICCSPLVEVAREDRNLSTAPDNK